MWTWFRNDGNVPTQYVANTASNRIVKLAPRRFANSYRLCKYQVANERCVDVSGRRYACTSTEESSSLKASASGSGLGTRLTSCSFSVTHMENLSWGFLFIFLIISESTLSLSRVTLLAEL